MPYFSPLFPNTKLSLSYCFPVRAEMKIPRRLSCKANFSRFVLLSWDKAQSADTPSNNNNNKTKKPKPEDSS